VLLRAQARLIRNTTWRCGKLEKSIIRNLYKCNANFGEAEVSVRDIMINLNITGKKTAQCYDALDRLEKRNIVKIIPL